MEMTNRKVLIGAAVVGTLAVGVAFLLLHYYEIVTDRPVLTMPVVGPFSLGIVLGLWTGIPVMCWVLGAACTFFCWGSLSAAILSFFQKNCDNRGFIYFCFAAFLVIQLVGVFGVLSWNAD